MPKSKSLLEDFIKENAVDLPPYDPPKSRMPGMIMPLTKHRFRVFPQLVEEELASYFMQQVVDAEFDMVAKTLTVHVRAAMLKESLFAVMAVAKTGIAPIIQALDGSSDGVVVSFTPIGSRLIKHTFDFTYKSSEPVIHEMQWSFCGLS